MLNIITDKTVTKKGGRHNNNFALAHYSTEPPFGLSVQ